MKYRAFALAALLALMCGTAHAEEIPLKPADGREIIAMVQFRNAVESAFDMAWVDSEGGVFYADMTANGYDLCSGEMRPLLLSLPDDFRIDTLDEAELAEFEELIAGIEAANMHGYKTAACDAGGYAQYVFRKNDAGESEYIELMEAGDDIAENMDGNAIELSTWLRGIMAPERYLPASLIPYGESLINSLTFSRGSYFGGYRDYKLERTGDEAHLTIRGGNGDETNVDMTIDAAELDGLNDIIENYSLEEWNGFSESDESILDGTDFSLRIERGASVILAEGYMIFPENYGDVDTALENYMMNLALAADEN